MRDPKEYWSSTGKGQAWTRWAPNGSLFRFFAQSGFNFNGKTVLEIGFGPGADLLEAQARGSRIFGVDINANAVAALQRQTGLDNFKQADAAAKPFDFGVEFDAIYSTDTICYLTDEEISVFARHCFDVLAPNGRIVVHFIESDWMNKDASGPLKRISEQEWEPLAGNFAPENPIRILDPVPLASIFESRGGHLIGWKTLSETFGVREEYLRRQRFLMFERRGETVV